MTVVSPAGIQKRKIVRATEQMQVSAFKRLYKRERGEMTQQHSKPYETNKIYLVNTSEMKPNPHQPRKHFDEAEIEALAKDIGANGLLQNITFTLYEGELIIVSGERRLRAHKLLNKETIEGKYVEGDLRTLALMENILRSDLTAVELAESVAALKEQKQCSNDEIVALIGKQKSTVSEILKVASLPGAIRDDARTKPYMTRERLLKVARKKNEEEKRKTYERIRFSLEETAKQQPSSNSGAKPRKKSIIHNRYIKAQVRLIESIVMRLEDSHKKMIEKISDEMHEEDKTALKCALDKLQEVVSNCFPHTPR